MSGVLNGQNVDQGITNAAFIFKNDDDITTYKLGLQAPAEGTLIDSIQKVASRLMDATGVNETTQDGMTYNAPTSTIANGDTHETALTKLADKFDQTTGHTHDGTAGNGGPIASASLVNVPLKGYVLQGIDQAGVTGSSTDVSASMIGVPVSSGTLVEGAVVTAPYNKLIIRQASGPDEDDSFVDGSGNVVYGRLTYSVGVWTLSYYVNISGTETAYSFASASDVRWYYQILFNPMVNPPIYSEYASIPSDNATQDVVDASSTQRGLVSTGVQSFGGEKTFDEVAHFPANADLAGSNIINVNNIQSPTSSASGSNGMAIGDSTTASGLQAQSFGFGTNAAGDNSTAMGNASAATGVNATALGDTTIAGGDNSLAAGFNTTAPAFSQTTFGRYNLEQGGEDPNNWVATDPLFVLGNGTGPGFESNALKILKNGNHNIAGKYNSGSFGGSAKALASNSGKDIVESATTATELGYVSGVTSSIQAQLNAKATDSLVMHLAGNETATGDKTFNGKLILGSYLQLTETNDAFTTGTGATATPTTTIWRLTNASLVSLAMLASPLSGETLVLINDTGATISILNDSGGTAANRILTGTGADLSLVNNACLLLTYCAAQTRWRVVGGSGSGGTGSSTVTITAGENLAVDDAVYISKGSANGDTGRTAGLAYKLDATNDNRIEYAGINKTVVTTGNPATIQITGEISFSTGMTQGKPVFASVTTPGAYQTTQPTTVGQWSIILGSTSAANKLIVNAALGATAILITNNVGYLANVVTNTSTSYSPSAVIDIVLCNATTGAQTINLPTAIGLTGKIYDIKKVDSSTNSVTIDANSTETIDGSLTKIILTQYQSIKIVSDGSNWNII